MNETNRENTEIERLLRRAKLPEPSAEFKERVTGAARQAWNETAESIPWQVPIRRLAISAAAAVLMISLANHYANRVPVGWQTSGSAAATDETPDLDDWLEVPCSSLVRHVTSKSPACSPATLLEHLEKIRQLLDESEPAEAPDTGPPVEHRSRLLPAPLNFYS